MQLRNRILVIPRHDLVHVERGVEICVICLNLNDQSNTTLVTILGPKVSNPVTIAVLKVTCLGNNLNMRVALETVRATIWIVKTNLEENRTKVGVRCLVF